MEHADYSAKFFGSVKKVNLFTDKTASAVVVVLAVKNSSFRCFCFFIQGFVLVIFVTVLNFLFMFVFLLAFTVST